MQHQIEAVKVIYQQGFELTQTQVDLLEAKLRIDTNDFDCRLRLLGSYSKASADADIEKWCEHFAWFVDNYPRHPITRMAKIPVTCSASQFEVIRLRWINQIDNNKEDSVVLGNAALSILQRDKRVGEKLLRRLEELEPESPEWSTRLFNLLFQDVPLTDMMKTSFTIVVDQADKALKKESNRAQRFTILQKIGQLALEFDELSRAEKCVEDMQLISDEMGLLEAQVHALRGRVALRLGDLEGAKSSLIRMTDKGFSNNLTLARDLLHSGERGFVADYLTKCCKIASRQNQRILRKWVKEIKGGKVPNLTNLRPE